MVAFKTEYLALSSWENIKRLGKREAVDLSSYTVGWGAVSFCGYWWTEPLFVSELPPSDFIRQKAPKSHAGPEHLGQTLPLPAHRTVISPVLFLQDHAALLRCQMGIWKISLQSQNISGQWTTPISHSVPHPLPICQIQIKTTGKKKSSTENSFFPGDLNTAYVLP